MHTFNANGHHGVSGGDSPGFGSASRMGRHRPPRRGGSHPGRGRSGGGRRGGRARRGDVRAGLLALLAEESQHGYQLMQNLDDRSGGTWRPSPGSVYPTLSQLEDEGLVTSADVDGRRIFTITDAGRSEVERNEGPAPWERVGRGQHVGDVRSLLHAWRLIAGQGSTEQIEAANAVIADARRKLYLILADEVPEAPGHDNS